VSLVVVLLRAAFQRMIKMRITMAERRVMKHKAKITGAVLLLTLGTTLSWQAHENHNAANQVALSIDSIATELKSPRLVTASPSNMKKYSLSEFNRAKPAGQSYNFVTLTNGQSYVEVFQK
jgi:predicted negative regulator of RcsB-dependent stress response